MKQNRGRELVRWHKEQEVRLGAKVDVTELWTGQGTQVVHCNVGERTMMREWRRMGRKEDPDLTASGSSTRAQAPCQLLQLFNSAGVSHTFDNCHSLSVLMP